MTKGLSHKSHDVHVQKSNGMKIEWIKMPIIIGSSD